MRKKYKSDKKVKSSPFTNKKVIRRVRTMKVTGKRNPGCPKYRWQDTIIKDLQSCSLNEENA